MTRRRAVAVLGLVILLASPPRALAGAPAGSAAASAAPAAAPAAPAAAAPLAPAVIAALVLRLEPAAVTLGETTSIRLVVEGAPDAARLRLTSTRGTLGPPAPTGAGRAAATYTPPAEAYPQIEILGAVDPATGAVGFLAVPLWAEDELPITTEPGATAELRVDGVMFGPVVADKKGAAVFALRAGPGSRAELFVTDVLGNLTTKPVDLRIPPSPRLLVLPRAEVVVAGGGRAFCSDVFVVDATGRPDPVSSVSGRAGEGPVVAAAAPRGLPPGQRVVCLRGPAAATTGDTLVRVAISEGAGAPAGGTWERRFPLVAGSAADARPRVSLLGSAEVIGRAGALRFVVEDSGGRRVRLGAPAVTVAGGRVTSLVEEADMVYRVTLSDLPRGELRESRLVVSDAATGIGGELTFRVVPPLRYELAAAATAHWWTGLGGGAGVAIRAAVHPSRGPLRFLGVLAGLEGHALAGGGSTEAGSVRLRALVARLEAGLQLVAPLTPRFAIAAAITAGPALLDSAARTGDQPLIGDRRGVPAFRAAAGARLALGPGALVASIDVLLLTAQSGVTGTGLYVVPGFTLGYLLHVL